MGEEGGCKPEEHIRGSRRQALAAPESSRDVAEEGAKSTLTIKALKHYKIFQILLLR